MELLKKIQKRSVQFDPEGSGYDEEGARKAGLKRQLDPETGEMHLPSRNPRTGQMLKGKKHKTWLKAEQGEKKAGYEIYKGKDGKYYSRKIK